MFIQGDEQMNEKWLTAGIDGLLGLLFLAIGLLLCREGQVFCWPDGTPDPPKEKKQNWDERRLLRFNGRCIIGLAVLILLGALFTLLDIGG